jgi:hypothetical protein
MHFSASGGMAGSAEDLMRWAQALMANDGPCEGLLDILSAPRQFLDGRASMYALGLARHEIGGVALVGHGGSLPGYKNHLLMAPALGAGVLVLSNREETDPFDVTTRVMAALLGATLPPRVAAMLPEGIFAEAEGPTWIEHRAGLLTFLGTAEPLFAGPEPGLAVSRSPYLPIALRAEGGVITGEIGGAARRFLPVPDGAAFDTTLAGTWRLDREGAELTVCRDGTLTLGTGPLRETTTLTPLGPKRALADRRLGPWRQRSCLWLRAPDRLRLVTARSRVLEFHRA